MCGICCFLCKISDDAKAKSSPRHVDLFRLRRRGPDSYDTLTIDASSDVRATFCGCTLHFQGAFTVQPIHDDRSNVLLWNGEIFGGIEVKQTENDGRVLLSLLALCRSPEELLDTMARIQGPWAFVYWQSSGQRLWFGRDILGRRSLLYHVCPDTGQFSLSSVCLDPLKPWREVPAAGIYCVDLSNGSVTTHNNVLHELVCYPWLKPCKHEPSERRVVADAGDDTALCDAAGVMEQSWGGMTIRRTQLGVVAPLGFFNTALPCGIGTTPTSVGQSVDDTVTGSCANGVEGTPGEGCVIGDELTHSCIVTARETHARSTSHDAHAPTDSHDTHGSSVSQTVGTSCINTDRPKTAVAPSELSSSTSHVTTNPTDGATSSLTNWATRRQWELSETLLDFLSEAVRLRVQLQASRCHRCLTQELCNSRDGGDRLNSNTSVSTHDDDSRANCIVVSGEGGNHGSCCHDNIDPVEDTTQDPTLHRTSFARRSASPRETGNMTHQSHRPDGNRPHVPCQHALVSVLFSGGIDSLVLAALADRHVPRGEPIDLMNVAFEKRQPHQNNRKQRETISQERSTDAFDVPDRITGKQGLHQLNPERCWNFIEIDVTLQELQEARSSHVRHLIYPLHTILDDSIGCAIWFAARGRGLVTNATGDRVEYVSTARVVLVGMGADEQLAGYSRHRMKFQSSGWEGLIEEVQMEIGRISSRNLGRDDRVISDHARESRFPFLDENVVSFLNSLPLHEKANLALPRGVGEKLLLRLLALRLGLARSATLPKRAIQFGSRIAKMENRKERAGDACDRLSEPGQDPSVIDVNSL